MRNVITFDVRSLSECICVSNEHNGSDIIKLIFISDEYSSPQIEVIKNSVSTFYDLTIENNTAAIDLPYSDIFSDYGEHCEIRYVDSDKIGSLFLFYWFKSVNTMFSTMCVNKINTTRFNIVFNPLYNVTDISYSENDFDVDPETGEVTIKEVNATGINVTETDDVITNVSIAYDDSTSKSYDCTYENDRLVKFGEITINWSE